MVFQKFYDYMRDRQSSILNELKMTNRPAISEMPRASVLNEAKCKTFLVKMIFYYHANKTHFHKNGFALGLVLRVRVFGTRK